MLESCVVVKKTDVCADLDPSSDVAWPKQAQTLVGAGGTHGELCVRFASEDLREPIIKDNLLDDEVLQELLEKHKLDEWFKRALKAGNRAYLAEKQQQQQQEEEEEVGGEAGDAEEVSLGVDQVAEGETADVEMGET